MRTHWRGPYPSLGKRWSGKDSRTSGAWTVGEDKELAWEFMGGKERKTRKEDKTCVHVTPWFLHCLRMYMPQEGAPVPVWAQSFP